jgi:hypothetical protein
MEIPLRQVILESWMRSRQTAVDPGPKKLAFRRILDQNLRYRLRAN